MRILISTIIGSAFILVLIIVFGFIFHNNERQKKELVIAEKNVEINQLKTALELKDSLSLYQLYFENFQIKEYLLSQTENEVNFKKHLKTLPKFVFYHTEIDCNSCIEESISVINEYKSEIGEENILYLSSYERESDMHIFKRINKITSPIFNTRNYKLFHKRANAPVCFVIDKNGCSNCVFFSSTENTFLLHKYMSHITKKYFNSI